MTALKHPDTPPASARDDHNVRLAWATPALLPVVLALSVFFGPALGLEDQSRASFGDFVIVLLVLAPLFAIPVRLVSRFATRARHHGMGAGRHRERHRRRVPGSERRGMDRVAHYRNCLNRGLQRSSEGTP